MTLSALFRPWTAAGLTIACLATVARPGAACTTAVISGAATADGRPILWKNRDAADLHNQVVYRDDGKLAYLGLVNHGDALGMEIWAGLNSAGFAIMNAASYNLDDKETLAEGAIMKLALQSCRTVADFQALLDASNTTGRDTTANFGVIDATGGAAYFETGLKSYMRFDATDAKTAPTGYLVRTNYSDSGDATRGSGLIRAERARALIDEILAGGTLSVPLLLSRVARDVANARIGAFPLAPSYEAPFAYVSDSINRPDTAAVAVFAGVRPGEDPALATMWVILGQPVTGVAVPLWVAAGAVPPELAVGGEPAPLNAAFDRVRALLYPSWRGDLKRYLDVRTLTAPDGGVLARLLGIERGVFERTGTTLEQWRGAPLDPAVARSAQDGIARAALTAVDDVVASRK
jgi:hypothetical protein